jgi:hypothetical protein
MGISEPGEMVGQTIIGSSGISARLPNTTTEGFSEPPRLLDEWFRAYDHPFYQFVAVGNKRMWLTIQLVLRYPLTNIDWLYRTVPVVPSIYHQLFSSSYRSFTRKRERSRTHTTLKLSSSLESSPLFSISAAATSQILAPSRCIAIPSALAYSLILTISS